MTTSHIGRIVVGSLAAGPLGALALIAGPLAGTEEHVVAGTVLLSLAASWTLLAALSVMVTRQPQRWAVLPAAVFAAAGAGLVVLAPGAASLDRLGWVWPPLLLALVARTAIRVSGGLRSRARVWVVYPVLGVYALCALGAAYETVQESIEGRASHAPGQLVDVGGRQLHFACAGSGAPTVVLESGLGEDSAYWEWIATAVSADTRVCAYDRAGRGWSDSTAVPQDGVAIATDLHVLLERARVAGPYVLVAHSSGAQYVRIFAGRYPEQVAGMVLLDGQPAEVFEGVPAYPAIYSGLRRVLAVLPSLARLGVGRLISHADFRTLPAHARDTQRRTHASARLYRSLRDEFVELPASMQQARSFQSLGARPLVVVTAAQDALVGWLPLQEQMAALSTNSSHRVVPYTHEALITDETVSRISTRAVVDVVRAVRFGHRLNSPIDQPTIDQLTN